MAKSIFRVGTGVAGLLWAQWASAGTAVFQPTGSISVPRGEPVSFVVTVSASAGGFNSADIVIGSTDAADVTFVYSAQWLSAFSNVSPVSYDNGFFLQDVYTGGNHSVTVGASLALGTVTIDTTGMAVGAHSIVISNALDGISTLGLSGVPEPLTGSGAFQITPPIPAVSTWGAIVISLGIGTLGTVVLRGRPCSAP